MSGVRGASTHSGPGQTAGFSVFVDAVTAALEGQTDETGDGDMTGNDVAVAALPDESNAQRPDRSLAEQLVEQTKADGRSLVGPGGLLADLTKHVLSARTGRGAPC